MCSIIDDNKYDLFKEYNIESIIFRDRHGSFVSASVSYNSGKKEIILIKKSHSYKNKLISALQNMYNIFKGN